MPANIARISLSLVGGEDITDRIEPRLSELRLIEKREAEADEIELTLSNADGALAIPEPGRQLDLALGWISGVDRAFGLVDKGRFIVDEVGQSGPPDVVTIKARGADLAGLYRQRRTKSWRDTTLGAILTAIAARHDAEARIDPALASLAVPAIEQEGKSDMAFVRDLGRRYDAVATWKAGALIFAPIGTGTSVSGVPLAALVLEKRDGWKWSFGRAEREAADGAEAQWHDTDAGRRRTVSTGGRRRRRLKRVYASEAEARTAATSTAQRAARQPYTFEYDLAVADCAIQPEAPVRLSGWSAVIDAIDWIVESVETDFGPNGLIQRLKLESR